jgi:hypothetical protein
VQPTKERTSQTVQRFCRRRGQARSQLRFGSASDAQMQVCDRCYREERAARLLRGARFMPVAGVTERWRKVEEWDHLIDEMLEVFL